MRVYGKVAYEYGELNTDGTVNSTKNTGNIARQTLSFTGLTNPMVQAYKYDSLYRLTEAKETANSQQNWIQNFGYDRYGNRTAFSQNIVGTTANTTPTVDVGTNRFNPNQGFTYDKNGNVVNDIDAATSLSRQFVFNGDNKQTEVKKDGVTIGRYFYDGEGKRVKKVTDTETTVFVYSSGKLIAEYSTQLATEPSTNYTTTDHLGTPRIITNELGQVKARRDFMPFGEELFVNVGARSTNLKYGTSADDIRQKFTGYQKDSETNLDFAEARMYENRYARFTAVDPLLASGKSASPQTFNRYVYVRNAPLIMIDPTGEIGDYYDRRGNYLGNDTINDGLVYFADEVRRDNKYIYVTNVKPTTIEQVRPGTNAQAANSQALGTSPSNFSTISERAGFYRNFQNNYSTGTRWAGAASSVAEDVNLLTGFLPRFFGYSNDELAGFANTGNSTIFADVFPKLGGLKLGGPQNAFSWDATTLSQEQNLIQPLYENLTGGSFNLLENNVKRNFGGPSVYGSLGGVNSTPFPQDRDLRNVGHRWEFGMKEMGYSVTPNQMPNPGTPYTSGEMYNRFNPGRPVGPVVVRFRF